MLTPKTEAELAEALRDATAPLSIRGGNTRGFAPVGDAISTARLSGITLYEPGALTLCAQAGTPVAEVEKALAKENQILAFEPMDHRALMGTKGTPTLGGVFAGNISGPRRIQAGAARDFALGVRFVDGSGQIIKNGGRVMKNVTGYDLVKLMCGSWGTLSILTEVSMKVLPMPETSATLRMPLAGNETALTQAMSSPFDITGAAVLNGEALIRVEGFEASVAYRADALKDLLAPAEGVEIETGKAAQAKLWKAVRDVTPLKECPLVWRASMVPSAMTGSFLPRIKEAAEFETVLDWAGGLCWLGLKDVPAHADAVHQFLQTQAADAAVNGDGGGHVTLIKGAHHMTAPVSRFQPEPLAVQSLTHGLRAKFDPRGLLNQGLMN